MFDDVFRMATLCTEKFRDGVRDSFGDSIIAGALEPILKEINSLRNHNEEFHRQAADIGRMLEEARSMHLTEQ
jgi:hypothetical protein